VLAVEPRGTLDAAAANARAARPSLLGPYARLSRRAQVVGRTLVGLRAEGLIRAMDHLAARPDVDPQRLFAHARGGLAVALLHAATLDARIARVALEEAPVTWRAYLAHPIHRDLPEVLVPGALRDYDLDDLLLALAPRPVAVINPLDPVGQPLTRGELQRALGGALAADRPAGAPPRIHLLRRGRRDPLRWQ
jgi:hypothetical protein